MKTRPFLSLAAFVLATCGLVAQNDPAPADAAPVNPADPAAVQPTAPAADPGTAAPVPVPVPAPATIPPPPANGRAFPNPGLTLPSRTNRMNSAVPRAFPRSFPGGPATNAAVNTNAAAAVPATANAATLPGAPKTNTPALGAIQPGRQNLPGQTAVQPGAPGTLPPPATGQVAPSNEAPLPGFNPATNPDPNSSTNIVVMSDGKLKFVTMPLEQFLMNVYARKVGKTVLRPATLPAIAISFEQMSRLTDAELLQAYDSVLALNGITTIPTGDKFVTIVPSAQAPQEGAAFMSKGKGDLPEASQYVTTIIQLKHVKPSEIVNALTPFAKNPNNIVAIESTSTLVLRDFAINVKRMLEVVERVDVVIEEDYTLEVIPIRYGRVEDIYQTLSGVIGGSAASGGVGVGMGSGTGLGTSSGFGNSGSQGGFGRGSSMNRNSSSRYGSGSGSGSRYGSGYNSGYNSYNPYSNGIERVSDDAHPGEPGDIRPFQTGVTPQPNNFANRLAGANRAAGTGAAGQKPEHSIVDDARIIPDMRSNSLLVYATKKDMEQIKKVVEKVDTLLAQVLIEGIVMNVSLSDGWNYGVSAGQRPKAFNGTVTGGGTINNSGNPLNSGINFLQGATTNYPNAGGLGYTALLGNKWDLALSAAASDSRIDLIQRPRIITSHSVPASFFVGSELPYRQGGYSYGGQDSFYYTSLPVGIGIDVTPFITPDSLVVMEISQNIDAVSGTFDPASGIPPTTSNRRASAVVTVHTGDVILLGGFLDNNSSSGSSGVPLLKDIPLLGNLFKSRNSSKSKTELMILVRPTILPKPSDVAAYTEQSRRDSGNIQKLEQDFNEHDRLSKERAEADRLKAEQKARAREEKAAKKKK